MAKPSKPAAAKPGRGNAKSGKRALRRPPGRLTIAKIGKALRDAGGVQLHAADALKVDKSTICRLVKQHPELQAIIDEAANENVQVAHQNGLEFLHDEDKELRWRVSRFWLENKGQALGFGVRKLAFSDGEGNVMVPGIMVAPMKALTPEEWEARNAAPQT